MARVADSRDERRQLDWRVPPAERDRLRSLVDLATRARARGEEIGRCARCGMPWFLRTPGCPGCSDRHWFSRHRSVNGHVGIAPRCPCGAAWAEQRPGCRRLVPSVSVMLVLRVYRIPFSTNVERVSLALAHKGLDVEWEEIDPSDRGPVVRLSGQPLVPVLDHDGRVVADSTVILRYLEALTPEPPLFPRDQARRAELEVFLDWFNRVWKGPPNEIEAERASAEPDSERIDELGREITGSLELFEKMLAGRDYLFGEFSAADCAAFPFLKYGLIYDEADTEEFHLILREYLALNDRYPRVAAWISRVDAHPRA
jgi:glutathione S-transferase